MNLQHYLLSKGRVKMIVGHSTKIAFNIYQIVVVVLLRL